MERSRVSDPLPFRLQPRPWSRIAERARPAALDANGSRRVAPLVVATVFAAIAAVWHLGNDWIGLPSGAIGLASLLVALGFGAELLSFNQSKESAGSAAVIPFAAAAMVAPSAATVLLILATEIAVQVLHKRAPIKGAFNVAQQALSLSLAVLVHRSLGGTSFLMLDGVGFVASLKAALIPSLALLGMLQLVSHSSVTAAIAVSTGRPYLPILANNLRRSAPNLLINFVVAFYVAWLSVNLGFFGTAGMAVPIILVRQLYRTTVELASVTQELLELMVAAIEARDAYTSGHSRRVAKASEIIARAIGLSPAEVERVSVAALLHDVGKIDEKFGPILAKEGRLTPEEWEIMKRHPIRGAELVGLLTSLSDVVAPIRHHHENWDGTGYPDGLKEDQIPLASRIIMFADTLDAITTDRPYRKALGIEEARAEFIRFRGKQFDPTVCDRVISGDVWSELYQTFAIDERRTRRVS